MGKPQPDAVGHGSLAGDDVYGKILHGGVKDLLHRPVEPVDLVYEEDVPLAQIGHDGRKIRSPGDGGAGGYLEFDAHLPGDYTREGGLSQARGTGK